MVFSDKDSILSFSCIARYLEYTSCLGVITIKLFPAYISLVKHFKKPNERN